MTTYSNCETFVRDVEINDETVLNIHQNMVGDEGCVVWDAALVLANYFIYDSNKNNNSKIKWKNTAVIELGAGTGIVGLTAAVLGADVLLTDVDDYMGLLLNNIDCNRRHLKGNVKARPLIWGKLSEEFKNYCPKYILISDCIYYKESLEPLVETLESLCSKDSSVIFSYEQRFSQEKQDIESKFFQLINAKFNVEEVAENDLHPNYRSRDIKVLVFTKK